jgi:hypothetical protein
MGGMDYEPVYRCGTRKGKTTREPLACPLGSSVSSSLGPRQEGEEKLGAGLDLLSQLLVKVHESPKCDFGN